MRFLKFEDLMIWKFEDWRAPHASTQHGRGDPCNRPETNGKFGRGDPRGRR